MPILKRWCQKYLFQKNASRSIMPVWWINSELLNLPFRALHRMAPTTFSLHNSHCHPECCQPSGLWSTSLKQVGAKSQPHPCLESSCSLEVLGSLMPLVLSEHPELFIALLLPLKESSSISWHDCTSLVLTIACATGLCSVYLPDHTEHSSREGTVSSFLYAPAICRAYLFGCPGVW